MDLQPYVDEIRGHVIESAAASGDEAREVAQRLLRPLDAAIRLALQDALAAAAQEITMELAPGSVEVRLRGREPEFVVTPAPAEADSSEAASAAPVPLDADDPATARINLRLPEQLKARVDAAAGREGLSVNTWLVRAANAALQRGSDGPTESRAPRGGQRFTCWAR